MIVRYARYGNRLNGYAFFGKVEQVVNRRGQWVLKLKSTIDVAVILSRDATKTAAELFGQRGEKIKDQTVRAIGSISLDRNAVIITVERADGLFVPPNPDAGR